MERIDFLLLGYRRVKVAPELTDSAVSALLRAGIAVKIPPDGEFSVMEKDTRRLSGALSGIKHELSELRGLPGAILAYPYKLGIAVGVLISLLLAILSSNLIWDVRVEGNENLSDTRVKYEIGEAGLHVGGLWSAVDRSVTEATMLENNDELAWININRRGGVAYVVVAERSEDKAEAPVTGYSNIVASCDCVIEELTVKSGVAMVKVGDTVRRGDLLISGVMPEEAGGGFCRADGRVVGRVTDTVRASVDREYEKITDISYSSEKITVKIFNFPINIFRKYGNSGARCDIIKEIQTFSLFGASLPVELHRELAAVKQTESAVYDDARLVRLCAARLQSETARLTVDAELIKIRTFGDYTESGYEMYSDVVLLTEVGKSLPFEAEE